MPGRFRVKKQHFDSLGVKEPVIKIKLVMVCQAGGMWGPRAASFLATSPLASCG